MEIKFEADKEALIKANKAHLSIVYKKLLLFCAFFAGFVATVINLTEFYFGHFLFTFFIYFLLTLLFFASIRSWGIYNALKKLKLAGGRLQYDYLIQEEGIKTERPDGIYYFRWFQIKNSGLIPGYVYFTVDQKKTYLIPSSAFENLEQQKLFLNTLQNQINSEKYPLPKHPSYWRGLLGLIPIVGLVNGIIMLRAGTTNYKNGKYSLIGFAGILLNLAMFSWVDNHNFTTPAFVRVGFTTNAQMELNSLVKEVEFYKIQNGNYPDSLQQLNIKKEFTNIYDPLSDDKKAKPFNYYRIGSKYTLFSSGVDEKPNTADDIFPSIDTSKTGLIINRAK